MWPSLAQLVGECGGGTTFSFGFSLTPSNFFCSVSFNFPINKGDIVLSLADGGMESCMVLSSRALSSEVDFYFIWQFLFFSGKTTEGVAEGMNEISAFTLDFEELWGW